MPKAKVVYIGTPFTRQMEGVAETVPEGFTVVTVPPAASPDEMCRAVEDADFLILRHDARTYPDEVYRAGKKLKLIQLMGIDLMMQFTENLFSQRLLRSGYPSTNGTLRHTDKSADFLIRISCQ